MIGPVLSLEIMLGGRRNRLQTFRRVLAAWQIAQCAGLFLIHLLAAERLQVLAINRFVDAYYGLFLVEHFVFLLIATPAFVAGAITDEKAQGTLQHLLTADVTSWEIIIGKLLGRLAQVAFLSFVGWPVLWLVTGYGHRPIAPLLCLALMTAVALVVLGTASIWASVRSRQTSEAVLRVYLWFGLAGSLIWALNYWSLWLLLLGYRPAPTLIQQLTRVTDVLNCLNPLYVLDPTWGANDLREFGARLKTMLLCSGGFCLAWLGLSIWRLRPSTIRYMEGSRRKPRRLRWRRAVSDEPILWRESSAGRGMWRWVGVAAIAGATYASSRWVLFEREPSYFILQGGVAGVLLSFIVGVRASGAISGERERSTWDSLLLTPMDTWEIVEDKASGILRSVYPYYLAFAIPATIMAFQDKVSRAGAVGFTLSMLLIDWIALVYMAAAGLSCSARATSSWRSLVATLAAGYAYCFGILAVFACAFLWLGCTIIPFVAFFLAVLGYKDITLGVTMSICALGALGTTWVLWRRAVGKIGDTESFVDSQERYGRNFIRSLTSALRKHYQRLDERKRELRQPVDSSADLQTPAQGEPSSLAAPPSSTARSGGQSPELHK